MPLADIVSYRLTHRDGPGLSQRVLTPTLVSVEESRGLQKRSGHGDGSRDLRTLHYGEVGGEKEEGAGSSRSFGSCSCPEMDSPLKPLKGAHPCPAFSPDKLTPHTWPLKL